MKKTLIIVLVLVVLVIAAVYLYGKKGMVSYTTNPTVVASSLPVTGSTSTPVSTNQNSVSIANFSFNPSTLTVKVGTTVTWTNNDSVTHSIKSANFNSPSNLNPGDTFSFTFTTPGTYNYNCGIHPSMMGTIIVQ